MNHGIYGQYSVEVLKQDGESYYPFGTGYQKNVILDEFFGKVLSGWKHSPQAWMQTCITNTGSNAPSRFDTTGTFKYGDGPAYNDRTWASTVFLASVNTGTKTLSMSRDFLFDTVTEASRTYREAMVGLFYKDDSDASSVIESDIALSHFVFPEDITLVSGQRLKILYNLNLVVDYLSPTGSPFQLAGDDYNFNGKIKIMSDDIGIYGYLDTSHSFFSFNNSTSNAVTNLRSTINSNINSYTSRTTFDSYPHSSALLGGFKTAFDRVGFYSSGGPFTQQTYPSVYESTQIAGNSAQLSISNYDVNDSGAYTDIDYYFPPNIDDRHVSGILLTATNTNRSSKAVTYLQFDSGITIFANDPISMRIRWSFNRL